MWSRDEIDAFRNALNALVAEFAAKLRKKSREDIIKKQLADLISKLKNPPEGFKERVLKDFNDKTRQQSFADLLVHSFHETLSQVFHADDYNAGRNVFVDGDIKITHYESRLILLQSISDEYPELAEHVKKITQYNRDYRTRIAAFFGAPTQKQESDQEQSWKHLWRNFIFYKDRGSTFRNVTLGILGGGLNTISVCFKLMISCLKIATEFVPYGLSEICYALAAKALLTYQEDTRGYVKAAAGAGYLLAKIGFGLFRTINFFGRAITSPAKGVVAAAREGTCLAGRGIVGDILATIFAIASLGTTVLTFLVLVPLKLAFSWYTTVPYLPNFLPGFICKPLMHLLNVISPPLATIGDAIANFLSPILKPVMSLLGDAIPMSGMGIGAYCGLAAASADTSLTLFGYARAIRLIGVGAVIVGSNLADIVIGSGKLLWAGAKFVGSLFSRNSADVKSDVPQEQPSVAKSQIKRSSAARTLSTLVGQPVQAAQMSSSPPRQGLDQEKHGEKVLLRRSGSLPLLFSPQPRPLEQKDTSGSSLQLRQNG